MTTAIKSVSVSLEFVELAKKHRISMSEAVRVGISVILAELGETRFLNKTNLGRNVMRMADRLQDMQDKLNKYEEKHVFQQKADIEQ